MSDQSGLIYLTEKEAEAIKGWVLGNGYTLESGYFELQFDISPWGDTVIASWHQEGKQLDYLEVYDEDLQQRQYLETPVDRIVVDGVEVGLTLSDRQLEKYFLLARECTEAHLEEDCEPPGYGLVLRIQKGACSLITGREVIESIPLDIRKCQ